MNGADGQPPRTVVDPERLMAKLMDRIRQLEYDLALTQVALEQTQAQRQAEAGTAAHRLFEESDQEAS